MKIDDTILLIGIALFLTVLHFYSTATIVMLRRHLNESERNRLIKEQANELRIGNILMDNGFEAISDSTDIMDSVVSITSIWDSGKLDYYIGRKVGEIYENESIKEFSPIPLTEDWLVRFGFRQSKGKYGANFHIMEDNGYIVMFTVEHWTDCEDDSKWKNHWHVGGLLKGNKLQYVHQLQNLYFALTGEELQLKESTSNEG